MALEARRAAALLMWEVLQGFGRRLRRGMGLPSGAHDPVALHLPVLLVLSRRGPQRLVDLARLLNLPTSTLSEGVERMVAEGLVERTPNPRDRRSVLLGPTAAGRARLPELCRGAQNRAEQLLEAMGDEAVQHLLLGLRALADVLAADGLDPDPPCPGGTPEDAEH